MLVRHITQSLSEFVQNLAIEKVPRAVRERVGMLATDSIGIAVRARHEGPLIQPLLRALRYLDQDQGGCSVIGDSGSYTPWSAALLNGTLIHALDFDDTHAPGALHPSATTLAAALATAETESSTGADVVTAVIAGYEIQCRLSKALQPAKHYDRGFHPTATCGVFGATAASAKLKRLPASRVEDAFGIALSMAAGSMQFLENGAWTKAFQVGNSAAAGVLAATLASEGFRGASGAFEGANGFLNSFSPEPLYREAVDGLNSRWETLEIAIKPYPACRFAHSAMDGLIELRTLYKLNQNDIEDIRCGLSRKALDLVGLPIEKKRAAASTVERQFSMPFLAAVALLDGAMGWDSYCAYHDSEAIEREMQKVSVFHDSEVEALFPDRFAASIEVRMYDGRRHRTFVKTPLGDPENFVTDMQVRQKFDALVQPYLGAASDVLFDQVIDLERADIPALMRATRAPADTRALI